MKNQEFVTRYPGKGHAYFLIADHLVAVAYDQEIDLKKGLMSFAPFAISTPYADQELVAVFDLVLEQVPADDAEAKLLSDVSIILDERFKFHETAEHYITTIGGRNERESEWKMFSAKDFKSSTVYCNLEDLYSTFKCNWLLMVAFGQAVLAYDTILMHSSVIEKDGKGYAFLGKSGTGKSTHSRLWLEHIPGTQLLNDDNPAVRVIQDGRVLIYGTPWSGKTHCYKQRSLALGAIVRLQQAPANQIEWKKGAEALISLLPSGSAIRWNTLLFNRMLANLERIVAHVPVAQLKCLPDKQAAELCYSESSSAAV